MEKFVLAVPSEELRFRAMWESTEERRLETAELGYLDHSDREEGRLITGGVVGEVHRYPIAMVWSLLCNPDWTLARFRGIPHSPSLWFPSELHLRYDGERRWWDEQDRELEPDTRDAPFVGWREGVCWHTPVLLHIGLEACASVEVEVLQINLQNGALRAVPHQYTPLGGGEWNVHDANYDDVVTLRVDGDGIVKEIQGARSPTELLDDCPFQRPPCTPAKRLLRWGTLDVSRYKQVETLSAVPALRGSSGNARAGGRWLCPPPQDPARASLRRQPRSPGSDSSATS